MSLLGSLNEAHARIHVIEKFQCDRAAADAWLAERARDGTVPRYYAMDGALVRHGPEMIRLFALSHSTKWPEPRILEADLLAALTLCPLRRGRVGAPARPERDAAIAAIRARHAEEPFASRADASAWARERYEVPRRTLGDWVRLALPE